MGVFSKTIWTLYHHQDTILNLPLRRLHQAIAWPVRTCRDFKFRKYGTVQRPFSTMWSLNWANNDGNWLHTLKIRKLHSSPLIFSSKSLFFSYCYISVLLASKLASFSLLASIAVASFSMSCAIPALVIVLAWRLCLRFNLRYAETKWILKCCHVFLASLLSSQSSRAVPYAPVLFKSTYADEILSWSQIGWFPLFAKIIICF